MGRWEYRYLGFDDWPKDLTVVEVDQFCSLAPAVVAVIHQKQDDNHRLGLALQICFLRMTGRVLNSATRVDPRILEAIGPQVGAATPDLMSLRALYVRKRTLHEHQREAMAALSFERTSERVERGLIAFLRREAVTEVGNESLIQRASIWLYQRRYLIPNRRMQTDLVVAARRHRERQIELEIDSSVSQEARSQWLTALTKRDDDGETLIETLQKTPPTKTITALETQADNVFPP